MASKQLSDRHIAGTMYPASFLENQMVNVGERRSEMSNPNLKEIYEGARSMACKYCHSLQICVYQGKTSGMIRQIKIIILIFRLKLS